MWLKRLVSLWFQCHTLTKCVGRAERPVAFKGWLLEGETRNFFISLFPKMWQKDFFGLEKLIFLPSHFPKWARMVSTVWAGRPMNAPGFLQSCLRSRASLPPSKRKNRAKHFNALSSVMSTTGSLVIFLSVTSSFMCNRLSKLPSEMSQYSNILCSCWARGTKQRAYRWGS